ncbi:MAG: caspase family protein [Bacillota bacterium]
MQKIIIFIIFALLTSMYAPQTFAQVKGTSQTGSLRPKKTTANNPVRIVLTEPAVKNGEEINIENSSLAIRGKIEGNNQIKSLRINSQSVYLNNEDNTFYSDVKLQPGLNSFVITAIDENNSSSSFTFNVNSQALKTGVTINIIEPLLNSNNEVLVKEKSILVKVNIPEYKDIREVQINNKKANQIKKTDFYLNLKLSDGINLVNVKAIDKKGKITESAFRVIVDSDREGPVIHILEPVVSRGIKIVRKAETVLVKGKAEDKSGIYEVTINGVRTDLESDGTFSLNMFLALGENAIVVKALDNNLNGTIDTFYITRKLDDLIVAGKFYGLIIGINSYSGYWPPLKCALNDAQEVASVLKEKYGFDSVITILDQDATRRNILQKLEWFASNVTKEDNLLIFYAGHGQFNKTLNRGYWVPSDASSNSIADYIPNGEIRTFMAGIPARHILLITDACFGGDIFRGKTESYAFDPNNMEKYYREVYKRQSRLALTSGGLEEVRDEGKEGHSIFTYYLLKALKDNKSRFMDAAQLYNELRIAVANNSDQTPILQAVKDTYDEGGQFIFVRRKD